MQTNGTIDRNVKDYQTLMSPRQLLTDHPRTDAMTQTVQYGRTSIRNILDGTDSRKFVIVGPCSIHDAEVAHDYAARLKEVADAVSDRIVVIFRSYFEKTSHQFGLERA